MSTIAPLHQERRDHIIRCAETVGEAAGRLHRKSGWTRLRKVSDGTATAVAEAVLRILHPVRARVHTLTWDNGSEFAEHRLMDTGLEAQSDFAPPYSSWQRGCNENLNGLLRQYIPKGCDISTFTDDQSSRSKTSTTGVQGSDWASVHPTNCSSYPSNALHVIVELAGKPQTLTLFCVQIGRLIDKAAGRKRPAA